MKVECTACGHVMTVQRALTQTLPAVRWLPPDRCAEAEYELACEECGSWDVQELEGVEA